MRAQSSLSQEIDIFLSSEEVSQLETAVIQGTLIFRDREGQVCFEKPFELVLTDQDSARNYFVDLMTFPPNADFARIEKYAIMIYPLGYKQLVDNHRTRDRIETARVNLFQE